MASSISDHKCFVFVLSFLLITIIPTCIGGELTADYYAKTCPKAFATIDKIVKSAVAKDRRMAASLIRLHFHDCFVQGCDASLLLPDRVGFEGEQGALQNERSIRGLEVIDAIKMAVENVCPGVVSCADILAIAARDSSIYVKGPSWTVKLGRRDSLTAANRQVSQTNLPLAGDNLTALIANFQNQGLNEKDMVALSGSHSIGLARCITFRRRIYNESNIDPSFASARRRQCPSELIRNDTLAPLDAATPNSFDNIYYKNLIQNRGLLRSDQVLYNGGSSDEIVKLYSKDKEAFFRDFGIAMVKMGDINPLTGSAGQIRKICSAIN